MEIEIPLHPPFSKGDDYPSLLPSFSCRGQAREVGRDLRKLFPKETCSPLFNFPDLPSGERFLLRVNDQVDNRKISKLLFEIINIDGLKQCLVV